MIVFDHYPNQFDKDSWDALEKMLFCHIHNIVVSKQHYWYNDTQTDILKAIMKINPAEYQYRLCSDMLGSLKY